MQSAQPVSGETAYLDPAYADASRRIADAMTLHAKLREIGKSSTVIETA